MPLCGAHNQELTDELKLIQHLASGMNSSMDDYSFATYEKDGRVATITLNRPEVMNALHLEAHLELAEIWEDFRDDPELWVAILTGAGDRAFSAGNDLKATAARTAAGTDVQGAKRPPFGRITRDFDCPKPMIAAVNGVAVGGGLEMALACAIVIAADHASACPSRASACSQAPAASTGSRVRCRSSRRWASCSPAA
jgi:1,4-dihydroxy-2-naphthoyl-CoA synthase